MRRFIDRIKFILAAFRKWDIQETIRGGEIGHTMDRMRSNAERAQINGNKRIHDIRI